jgi:hypothetical protein
LRIRVVSVSARAHATESVAAVCSDAEPIRPKPAVEVRTPYRQASRDAGQVALRARAEITSHSGATVGTHFEAVFIALLRPQDRALRAAAECELIYARTLNTSVRRSGSQRPHG